MSAPEKASIIAAREYIAAVVRQHGVKRGLDVAAQRLGISERWARGIHYSEAAFVSHALDRRAQAARNELARQRAAQLRAELAELEEPHGGLVLEESVGVGGAAR